VEQVAEGVVVVGVGDGAGRVGEGANRAMTIVDVVSVGGGALNSGTDGTFPDIVTSCRV
jgi:hypothetical protein